MTQTLRQRAILKIANDKYKKSFEYKLIMAEKFLAKLKLKQESKWI